MPVDSTDLLKRSKATFVGQSGRRPAPAHLAVGLVLVFAAATTGCGHPVQKKLEGRWLGDAVENFDDDAVASATGWAKGASMEFAGSTVTVTIPAEEPRSGKYKVVSVHEGDVELSIQRRDGALDKARFKLDDERSMRWVLDDGRAVVLRREQ